MLGICYGFQATMQLLGGEIAKAPRAEYGLATFVLDRPSPLFKSVPKRFRAWMSHGDEVMALPEGWKKLAHTSNCAFAAASHERPRSWLGAAFIASVWLASGALLAWWWLTRH